MTCISLFALGGVELENSKETIKNLLELLNKKEELYTGLLEITMAQKKDIEENDANNIEKLIEGKQVIIDEINVIDKIFVTTYENLKTGMNVKEIRKLDIIKYPELSDVKAKVGNIMSLANEIMQLEKENKDKLTSLFEDVKRELKNLKQGKKSLKAYDSKPIMRDGIYIDKKK